MTSKDTSKEKNSTPLSKKDARQIAKQFRANLSGKRIEKSSEQICLRTIDLIDSLASDDLKIHIYQPIRKLVEIDTDTLTNWLSPKHIVIVQSKAPFFPNEQFDVVILPGLACDEKGNRVGYGMGAYDKFLSNQRRVIKIGLQYDDLVFHKLESEDHDQNLDFIITDKRTIKTNQ